MQAKILRDRLGTSLRVFAPAPADLAITPSMWDLLSATECAEHEQTLRPQADAWAAAHPKRKRPGRATKARQITARATSRS
jgi:hypothetical protein